MKKVILLSFLFAACQTIFAQGYGVIIKKNDKGERETQITSRNTTGVGPSTITRTYKGSFLFVDSFVMGAVKLHNTKVVAVPVLYNLKTEKVSAQIDGKVEEFYDTFFSIGRHKFTYINGHYYEIVKDRKTKLLKRYDCKLVETPHGDDGAMQSTEGVDGEFVTTTSYYFYFENKKMKDFKLTKKSVLNALKDNDTALIDKFKALPDNFTEVDVVKVLEN